MNMKEMSAEIDRPIVEGFDEVVEFLEHISTQSKKMGTDVVSVLIKAENAHLNYARANRVKNILHNIDNFINAHEIK